MDMLQVYYCQAVLMCTSVLQNERFLNETLGSKRKVS